MVERTGSYLGTFFPLFHGGDTFEGDITFTLSQVGKRGKNIQKKWAILKIKEP